MTASGTPSRSNWRERRVTVPYSLATIGSHGVAKATLELQGGLAAKLGVNVGDMVQNRSLDR